MMSLRSQLEELVAHLPDSLGGPLQRVSRVASLVRGLGATETIGSLSTRTMSLFYVRSRAGETPAAAAADRIAGELSEAKEGADEAPKTLPPYLALGIPITAKRTADRRGPGPFLRLR